MLRQLMFIITGFVIGQGSMFFVQSYFVVNGQFELIANVGIALGLLSLMQWAADGGGVFILSKLEGEKDFSKILPNYIIARVIFSGLFYFLVLFLLRFAQLNEIVQQVLNFIPIVIFFWSLNLTGLIDKLGKNNLVGPASGLSWLFSSIAVVVFNESELFGIYLGAAFSFGLLMTITLQFIVIRKFLLVEFDISFCSVKNNIYKICSYNLAYLTSQGTARVIPVLINNALSPTIAGMYVYSKNISNTVSQLVLFTRRIEFPKILELVSQSELKSTAFIKAQRYSFLVLLLVLTFFTSSYVVAVVFNIKDYIVLIEICTLMIFILCIWLISSSFGQIYFAKGYYLANGFIVAFTNVIAVACMLVFVGEYGVFTVMLIESVMLILQILIYSIYLKSVTS